MCGTRKIFFFIHSSSSSLLHKNTQETTRNSPKLHSNPTYLHIYLQNGFKNVITIQNPPRNQEKRAKKAKNTYCSNTKKLKFLIFLLISGLLVCYIGYPKHRRDNSSQRNWAERRYWSHWNLGSKKVWFVFELFGSIWV